MSLRSKRRQRNQVARPRARSNGLKCHRSLLEPLEVRQMLTADPRILDLSAGHAAIYEGNSFALTASVDHDTPVSQVKFYVDSEPDGILNTASGHDTFLGNGTNSSGDQWTLSSIATGGSNAVGVGKQLFFAQATDSSSAASNVIAFPAEVLTSDPVLQPIDNDKIIAGRLYVTTAHADLPPSPGNGDMTYALHFHTDAFHTTAPSTSFDGQSGTLLWQPTTSDVSTHPYHFDITATWDNGSSQTTSEREFYLTVVSGAQYLTSDAADGSFSTEFVNGPVFYDYRSSQSQGLQPSISANIAPSDGGAAGTKPVVTTLTYDTANDQHPIVEADVPFSWLYNNTLPSTATFLTAQVSVLDHDGSSSTPLAQSDVVWYTLAGVATNGTFHLAVPVDVSSLPTDKYRISVEVILKDSSGASVTGSKVFGSGEGWLNDDLQIVNRSASDVGAGWAIAGIDQLKVDSDGAMLIQGDGNVHWFAKVASVYTPDEDTNLELTAVDSKLRLVFPDSSYEEFDQSTGNLLAQVDMLGNTTDYDYYAANDHSAESKPGALKSITDPSTRVQEFKYGSNGKLEIITDFADRSTTFSYDSSGRLITITRQDDSTQQFTYDSNGLLASNTNALGEATYYEYNQLQRPVRTIYPDGTYEVFQGSDTTSVAARTIVAYQSGQPVYLGSMDHPAPLIAWSFDNFGTVTSFAGAMGRMIDASGRILHFTTDASGEVSSQTEPIPVGATVPWEEGNSSFSLHDLHSQLLVFSLSVSSAASGSLVSSAYEYDDKFNLLALYNQGHSNGGPDTATERWDYTNGNPSNPHNVLYSHLVRQGDENNNPANARKTTYEHYPNGLLETAIDPLLNETTYTYTDDSVLGIPAGLIESITDPNGNVTRYDYYSADDSENDSLLPSGSLAESGLLKQVTVAYGTADAATTAFHYDAYGNVRQQVDPGGRVTQFSYDILGRMTESQLRGYESSQVAGPTATYVYDELGILTRATDPDGNRTLYLHNLSHQLAAVVAPDPDGGGLLPGPETVYYYSRTSQLDAVIDPLGRRTEYEYDARDQLVTLTEPDPGLINSSSPQTHYKYNDAGDLISVEDPLGNFITYTYSAYGHLSTVNSVDGRGARGTRPRSTTTTRNTSTTATTWCSIFTAATAALSRSNIATCTAPAPTSSWPRRISCCLG